MANKYNASGMGETMRINHAQLYNGPPAEGGSQPSEPRFTGDLDQAQPGDMGAGVTPRETPMNQHGTTGMVAPSAKQPDGAVQST
jgi:hypothetical protein|tara:strand:+ start:2275 stop:2529 length:255 start_codon:yes stop_codon:yes gene_type:complete